MKRIYLASWKELFKNPILFLPDVLFYLVFTSFSSLFIYYSGLFPVNNSTLSNLVSNSNNISEIFSQANPVKTVVSLLVLGISLFFLGAGLKAVKMTLIIDVLKKKKIQLVKLYLHSRKYIRKIIILKVYIFMIYMLLFFLLSPLLIFPKTITSKITLSTILFLLLDFLFFFRYQLLFTKEVTPFQSLISSLFLLYHHPKKVIFVWATIAITLIILSILGSTIYFTALLFIPVVISIINKIWPEFYKFKFLFSKNLQHSKYS